MLPRPGLPEGASRARMPAGSSTEESLEEEGWSPPQTTQRAREVGQVQSKGVSRWVAALQLTSAQPGLSWHIKFQINLAY